MKRIHKLHIFCLVIFFASIVYPVGLFAASLSLAPNNTTVSIGNIFVVNVFTNTEGKFINNTETEIQFPKDLVEVMSIDKSSSIFSLWVNEPTFSNISGTISFNGGVPNPGFQGSAGKILSVVFRAKKSGVASLVFTNAAVRENDGLGTDILSVKLGANVTIVPLTPVPQVEDTPVTNTVLNIPKITSSTHPNPNDWYNKNDVEISWKMPTGVTAVKTLLGKFADSDTSVLYTTPIISRKIDDIEDGVWYFHVNYSTRDGWSDVAHYRLQIDTESPFDVNVNTVIDDYGRVNIGLRANDSLSGIDYYSVKVNSDTPIIVDADDSGFGFSNIPILIAGEHTITVRAYDKAGNLSEKTVTITADTVSAITIDSYPEKIKVGEHIEIVGTAPYAGSKVLVSIKKDDSVAESIRVTADSYSKFNVKSQLIRDAGVYTVWAEVISPEGRTGVVSQKIDIHVVKPIMLQVGSYTTELLRVLTPAIALLLLLLLSLYYGWHKFFSLKKKINKDVVLMHERVHRALTLLSSETTKQLELLEKSRKKAKLSSEEQQIVKEIKESVDQIDLYIETQLKKIEDDDLK